MTDRTRELYEAFREQGKTLCKICGLAKPHGSFMWDDGNKRGLSKRCAECRGTCPDCTKRDRCPKHEALYRGPIFPAFRYRVRPHAVRRFIERVHPGLTGPAALFELLTLAVEAEETAEPPAWLWLSGRNRAFQRGYLVVSEDVVFALAEYGERGVMISTVLTRDLPRPEVDKANVVCFTSDHGGST